MAVAPSEANVIYAGGQVAGQSAVYYSTNSGVSWTRTLAAPGDTVLGLAADRADANRVFAATPRGVFVTTDRGGSWTSLPSGTGVRAIAVMPGCPDTVFCGGDSGVSVSRDRGQTWTLMNQGLTSRRVTSLEFGPGRLIAGTASGACFAWQLGTGVESRLTPASERAALSVRPCPGRGVVEVRLPDGMGRAAKVRLRDVSGREVLSATPAGPVFRVDGSRLGPGVYLVEVEAETGRMSARLVLTR